MQQAHLNLISYALDQGHAVSVWDGEEWQVKQSTSYNVIKEAIDSVDESQLRILDTNGKSMGTAWVIPDCSFEPDECVVDYSVTPFMVAWEDQYNATA